MLERLATALDRVALSQALSRRPDCARVAEQVLEICRARLEQFV